MKTRTTRRLPDAPPLTVITGEPEIRLRTWLAGHPGWETWKEHGIWHAVFGPALVTDRDFSRFVRTLEELGYGRVAPAEDYPATGGPADPGDLPDIIA